MPLGLLAVIAIGVHAAADHVDDLLLQWIEQLDAWVDTLLARSPVTADWVNAVGSRECTMLARGLALAWELSVDLLVGLPALGYSETDRGPPQLTWALEPSRQTWRDLFSRLNQRPTPMRLARPLVTAVFVVGGAATVSRLVESTLFVGLVGDVAPADVATPLARVAGGLAVALVLATLGWRAVLRALQHADARCEAAPTLKARLLAGSWGTALALPLAVALALEARTLLSVVL